MTAFILLLAFPPLEAASVMQLMDNVAHTSFSSCPPGLAVGGNLAHISGGGSPLLWQHLFWFLGHPEVYVLILPAMGIVCEILANNTRKPIWGYKSLVYASLARRFSCRSSCEAHHMYMTRHGHENLHVLPSDDDDHLDSLRHYFNVLLHVALGWVPSASTRRCSSRSHFCRCSVSVV